MGHPSAKRSKTLLGNTNGTKVKDPVDRQAVYKAYCKHVADGYPKQSFSGGVNWQTIERYMEESPMEFDPILMQEAMAKRYQYWFGEGKTLMQGGYKNGSPVVWQTIMRNMFKDVGWDAQDTNAIATCAADKILEKINERK